MWSAMSTDALVPGRSVLQDRTLTVSRLEDGLRGAYTSDVAEVQLEKARDR